MPDFPKKLPLGTVEKLKLPDPQEVKNLALQLEQAEKFDAFGLISRLSGYTESLRKELKLEQNKNRIEIKEYQKSLKEIGKSLSDSNTFLTNTEIALRTTRTTAVVVGATIATGGIVGGTITGGLIAGSTAVIGSSATAIAAGTTIGTVAGLSGNIVEAIGHLDRGNQTRDQAIQNALNQTIVDLQATATASAGMLAGVGFAGRIVGPITSLLKKVLFGGVTGSAQAISSQLMNTGINTISGRENFSFNKLRKELLQNGLVGLLAGAWGTRLGVAREGMKTVTTKGLVLTSEVAGDLGLGLGSAKTFSSLEGRAMTFEEIANEVSGSIVGTAAGEFASVTSSKKSVDYSDIHAVETRKLFSETAIIPFSKGKVISTETTIPHPSASRKKTTTIIHPYENLVIQTLDKLIDLQSKIDRYQAGIDKALSLEFSNARIFTRWSANLKAKFAEFQKGLLSKEFNQVLAVLSPIEIEFFKSEKTPQNLLKKINALANSNDNIFPALADYLLRNHYQWALANPKDPFSKIIFDMAKLRIETKIADEAPVRRESLRLANISVSKYSTEGYDPETRIVKDLYSKILGSEKVDLLMTDESLCLQRIKSEINHPGTIKDLNIFEQMLIRHCKLRQIVLNSEYAGLLDKIAGYLLSHHKVSRSEVKKEIAKLKICVAEGIACGCGFDPDIKNSIKITIDEKFRISAGSFIQNAYSLKKLEGFFESFLNTQYGSATKEFKSRFKELQERFRNAFPEYESLLNQLAAGSILPLDFQQKVREIIPEYPKVFRSTNPFVEILLEAQKRFIEKYDFDLKNKIIDQPAYDQVIIELTEKLDKIIQELKDAWSKNEAYPLPEAVTTILRTLN